MPNFSLRAGFVYRGIRQNRQRLNANQAFDAFNVPVAIADPGPDVGAAQGQQTCQPGDRPIFSDIA